MIVLITHHLAISTLSDKKNIIVACELAIIYEVLVQKKGTSTMIVYRGRAERGRLFRYIYTGESERATSS